MIRKIGNSYTSSSTPDPKSSQRQPSCLAAVWEAIKAFFSQLCCALCCYLTPAPSRVVTRLNETIDIKQEEDSPFEPLEQLKEKRKNSPLTFSSPNRQSVPKLKKFEEKLNEIQLPSKPTVYKVFANGLIDKLVQLATPFIDKLGFLAIEPILQACEDKIDTLNPSLGNGVEKSSFSKCFVDLIKFKKIESQLQEIAAKPYLSEGDCTQIRGLSQELDFANEAFCKNYPSLTNSFEVLVDELDNKPLSKECPEIESFKILSVSFEPKALSSDALKQHQKNLMEELIGDLQQLIESIQPGGAPDGPQAEQIIHFYTDEVKRIQQAIGELAQENSIKDFQPINRQEAQLEIEPLIKAWQKMLKVSSVVTTEKVKLLEEISLLLPNQDAPIWDKFPLIQLKCADIYESWHSGFFSNRTLFTNNSQEIQIRQQLAELTKTIGNQLGCIKENHPIYVENQVENDLLLSEHERDRGYEEIVRKIQDAYWNLYTNSQQLAIASAVQIIELNIQQYNDFNQKITVIDGILKQLAPEIVKAIQPTLDKLPLYK